MTNQQTEPVTKVECDPSEEDLSKNAPYLLDTGSDFHYGAADHIFYIERTVKNLDQSVSPGLFQADLRYIIDQLSMIEYCNTVTFSCLTDCVAIVETNDSASQPQEQTP